MMGVGPAGKALRALRESGRRKRARTIGGRKRVGSRVEMRNDYSPWFSEMFCFDDGCERTKGGEMDRHTKNLRDPHNRSMTRSW